MVRRTGLAIFSNSAGPIRILRAPSTGARNGTAQECGRLSLCSMRKARRARRGKCSEIAEGIAFRDRAKVALLQNELGHEAGPAGLVRRAETRSGVAVEIFVEPEATLITHIVEDIS